MKNCCLCVFRGLELLKTPCYHCLFDFPEDKNFYIEDKEMEDENGEVETADSE